MEQLYKRKNRYFFILFVFLLWDEDDNNIDGWVLIFRVRINKMVLIVSILIQTAIGSGDI